VLTNSKPTGQTMAIQKIDARHSVTVLKFQGKQYGTSKSELSPDGKVMKVEDDITSTVAGHVVGKSVHYWDKK